MSQHLTAQSALNAQRKDSRGVPIGRTTKFVCPYNDCKTLAVQHWGYVSSLTNMMTAEASSGRQLGKVPSTVMSLCEACGRESIYIGGQIVLPADSDAPPPTADLPTGLVEDFEEARAILPRSPRGASALLRLVIQKLLPHLGATKTGIDAAIGELLPQEKYVARSSRRSIRFV